MKFLLSQEADVRAVNSRGATPLHNVAWSSGDNSDEFVARINATSRLLIAAGADVNAKDMHGGLTPLHGAAGEGHTELVQLLLASGSEVNARTYRNETPIQLAVSLDGFRNRDTKPVIQLLRKHGGVR